MDQNIHDVNWESVMNEMSDDYHLPSQKKSLRESIQTHVQDIQVLQFMYNNMKGFQWRANKGWFDRFDAQKRKRKKKKKKNEEPNNDGSDTQEEEKMKEEEREEEEEEEEGEEEEELSDPCRDKWSGVTCDTKMKPARIFAIDLSNNNLQGVLPVEIGQLTYLRYQSFFFS